MLEIYSPSLPIQQTTPSFGFKAGILRAGCILFLVICCSSSAHAQLNVKWLSVGSLHDYYTSKAIHPDDGVNEVAYGGAWYTGNQWPAIYPYMDHQDGESLYLGASNFEDETGTTFPIKVVSSAGRTVGRGGVIPIRHNLISRFEEPLVTVDDGETFLHANFVDEVDPEIPADQMIVTEVNTELGVTLKRRIMAWSQGYHDNYHINEFTLTNTGNVDEDAEIELPDQTIEDLYFMRQNQTAVGKAGNEIEGGGAQWGKYEVHDVVGFGARDFTEELSEKYRGTFTWDGEDPQFTEWDDIGAPALRDDASVLAEGDSTGRITSPGFFGRLIIHADQSPEDRSDDLDQPTSLFHLTGNAQVYGGVNPRNAGQMREAYDYMTQGRESVHHADVVTPPESGESWTEQMLRQTGDPSFGVSSGQDYMYAYGPYTLEPGDSIQIIIGDGVNGLDREATLEIGRAFKQAHGDGEPDRPIAYDADGNGSIDADEEMSKNEWVLTGRDSIFQTFRRMQANHESGYQIPDAPLPPSAFHVTSGTDRILLEWDVYPEANPQGFEIWRAHGQRGLWEFERIAEPESDDREFQDTNVQRGIGYYYHILSVGEVNNDDTGLTPTGEVMKSSLYYTQTYDPAFLRREPAENLESVRVVPNPYDLGADQNIRWPDVEDQIAFLNVPGQCTIRIYTEMGELVETIEHTNGSGDEFWDLTNSSFQRVASGIYMAVIEDENTGEQVIRKFVIVR